MAMNNAAKFVGQQIDACVREINEGGAAGTKLIEQIASLYWIPFHTGFEENPVISRMPLPKDWSEFYLYIPRYDTDKIRADFPILSEKVSGKDLVWLDNAATTQKPKAVIDRLIYFYEHENSNVHRGAHTLAARATDAYEEAREKVRSFINATAASEIIFVRGTTEGINLIAQTHGKATIGEDDEVLISCLEHHSNIVPWQMLCAEKGAHLRIVPIEESGQINLNEYRKMLGPKTKIVSLTHVSNALGTVLPIAEMVSMAHQHGATAVVDGAQAVAHIKVDVQTLDADFYVFSGHKIYGPTGIGAVFGKQDLLDQMAPYHGGGNMIRDVTFERALYAAPPHRFEAGTGNIADAVALGAAIDYVTGIGMDVLCRHEHSLMEYAEEKLAGVAGLRRVGCSQEKTSIISFVMQGLPNDRVGQALNAEGIAVRAGHHCAQPVLRRLGLEGTVRASLAMYNTKEEIDKMVWVLKGLQYKY